MTPDSKATATVGMSIRRGGAKLRAMSQSHTQLHVLLWQARETQRILQASATAQKTLLSDMAVWASSENRALSDVCSNFSEINALATAAQIELAQAYKSFRKDMTIVLESEKGSDVARRKLQEAEKRRHKCRRLVLQAQNRSQITAENLQATNDYANLQTQLAEAERSTERAHVAACEARSESEAVKLVIVRSTLSKLCQAQLSYAKKIQIIYQGGDQLMLEIPSPPPPGDHLSCIRYTGFDSTRNILTNVKARVQICAASPTCGSSSGASFVSTPITSPTTPITTTTSPIGNWASPQPSAPENPFLTSETEPPPPYNINFNTPSNGNRSWSDHRVMEQMSNSTINQTEHLNTSRRISITSANNGNGNRRC